MENSGSIFEFNNPVFTCLKFLDFLQGIEICAILAYFFPNLVAMATPSTPLKIQVACEFTKPIKPTEHAKNSSIFLQETEICAILAYIFLNLVAMATPRFI